MGIMVYSIIWVMQDFVHQPKHGYKVKEPTWFRLELGFLVQGLH